MTRAATTTDAVGSTVGTEGRRIGWAARRSDGTAQVSGAVRAAWAGLAALVVLAIWWALAATGTWSEIILPTPAKVWDAFVQSVTTHDGRRGLSGYYLWEHLWASLWRILRGVFWAFVIGVPIGLALGTWRRFELLIEPMISFLR